MAAHGQLFGQPNASMLSTRCATDAAAGTRHIGPREAAARRRIVLSG
jgi:hypothetical protein